MSEIGPLIFNEGGDAKTVRLSEAMILAGHRYGFALPDLTPRPRRRIVREER